MPAVRGMTSEKHGVTALRAVAPSRSLCEDKDVRDFHETRLHGLNVITQAGNENDDDAIGEADDYQFHPGRRDGFDEDLFFACGV